MSDSHDDEKTATARVLNIDPADYDAFEDSVAKALQIDPITVKMHRIIRDVWPNVEAIERVVGVANRPGVNGLLTVEALVFFRDQETLDRCASQPFDITSTDYFAILDLDAELGFAGNKEEGDTARIYQAINALFAN